MLAFILGVGCFVGGIKVTQHKEAQIQETVSEDAQDFGYRDGYDTASEEKAAEIADLNQDIANLEEMLAELQERLQNAKTEAEYNELVAQIAELSAQIVDLQSQLEDKQSELSTKENEVSSLSNQIDELNNQISALENEILNPQEVYFDNIIQTGDGNVALLRISNDYILLQKDTGLYRLRISDSSLDEVIRDSSVDGVPNISTRFYIQSNGNVLLQDKITNKTGFMVYNPTTNTLTKIASQAHQNLTYTEFSDGSVVVKNSESTNNVYCVLKNDYTFMDYNYAGGGLLVTLDNGAIFWAYETINDTRVRSFVFYAFEDNTLQTIPGETLKSGVYIGQSLQDGNALIIGRSTPSATYYFDSTNFTISLITTHDSVGEFFESSQNFILFDFYENGNRKLCKFDQNTKTSTVLLENSPIIQEYIEDQNGVTIYSGQYLDGVRTTYYYSFATGEVTQI